MLRWIARPLGSELAPLVILPILGWLPGSRQGATPPAFRVPGFAARFAPWFASWVRIMPIYSQPALGYYLIMSRQTPDSFFAGSQWEGIQRPKDSAALLDVARAQAGNKLILGISGKDSLAAWLYLRENGFEIVPYMLWTVPGGLSFEVQSREYYQDFFGQHIAFLPHPNFVTAWNSGWWQPPERVGANKSLKLRVRDYFELEGRLAEQNNLGPDYLAAIGYRAADNPGRRRMINNMGAIGSNARHYYYAVWDWKIADIMGIIQRYGAKLSQSYGIFGCTFDEYGAYDLQRLYHQRRADYDLLKYWFPLIGLKVVRYDYVN